MRARERPRHAHESAVAEDEQNEAEKKCALESHACMTGGHQDSAENQRGACAEDSIGEQSSSNRSEVGTSRVELHELGGHCLHLDGGLRLTEARHNEARSNHAREPLRQEDTIVEVERQQCLHPIERELPQGT